ncbi:MAG: tRNA (guanosine(37)-N1)-methyltransferase TrmD [Holosporales bacterium]|jgi:tRNA (guanine37-N1)-methyltransferase|nr:tRNA (guanosine(37)-N1)-methyltransferase TrmD [Holosporales bacterium]
MWTASVLTLFPEMFPGPLAYSLAGKGLQRKIWNLCVTQIRDFATDKHHSVDDTSCGHNAGMVMRPDVVNSALEYAVSNFAKVGVERGGGQRPPDVSSVFDEPREAAAKPAIIYMTPRGFPLTQKMVHKFAEGSGVVILCGRYEGVDERVIELWREERGLREICVGDYVLSGGEIPALTLIDACVRLLPNIVHNEVSLISESFELDLLEFPQYTRPCEWMGKCVPEVLLSGDHKRMLVWQLREAERITEERRPDVWSAYVRKNGGRGA